MHLVVEQYGVFLGKKSERLVVRDQNRVTQEVPLRQLEQITVAGGGISLSADLIRECVERGIQIKFCVLTSHLVLTISQKAFKI